ncbi:hypothetical protein [Nocardia australiensis]|uniref:hypothetical protein n=1 Tax=Nocardia australiensis TaxID=2887191 RepID=UPI001D1560DD|nr:hypothetical protein [Nocardia australiensis]
MTVEVNAMRVSAQGEIIEAIINAIESIDGLRPATPVGPANSAWWPSDARSYAIDLVASEVVVRLVASALPLPPLLAHATTAIRAALAETDWARASLRLVVAELDAAAFASGGLPGS